MESGLSEGVALEYLQTPRGEAQASEVAISPISPLACSATTIRDDVIDKIEDMIARLDAQLTQQLNEILHADEFQKLESAWHGLNYLVYNSKPDAELNIRFMNISKTEMQEHLGSILVFAGIKACSSNRSTNRN